MNWENLNVREFEEIIEKANGVCVIPIGCLEKHGYHLPLGTDITITRYICQKASEAEPFLIFPYYPFGQVSEVRHKLGTVALPARLQMELLEAICGELSRNGIKKIVFANGHGGNNTFLAYFTQSMLDAERDYTVYTVNVWEMTAEQSGEILGRHGITPDGGHADVTETSMIMAINASLVNLQLLDKSETSSMGRYAAFSENRIYTGIGWYADYPHQIAGDPTGATAAFGADLLECNAQNFARTIKLIKEDASLPRLTSEFYKKSGKPTV